MPFEPNEPLPEPPPATLQTLADEVDEAMAKRVIDVDAGRKIYEVLAALGEEMGDNNAPVEPDGAEFIRGLIDGSVKELRLFDPDKEED